MIAKTKNKQQRTSKNFEERLKEVQTKWKAVSLNTDDDCSFDDLFKQNFEPTKNQKLKAPGHIKEPTSKQENQTDSKIFDNQDLQNHDFSNQDLTKASFKNCNLSGADFSNATLKEANFTGANLSGVTLNGADIENAILMDIQIDELGIDELQALIEYLAKYYPHKLSLHLINLTLLDLSRIDLSQINLRGVDFTGCDMTGVNVLALDLSSCIISPEQIHQALGRPPTGLELQQMFMPKNAKGGLNLSNFAKQMEKLFQNDGSTWGVIDVTRDKGIAIEDLMKFGKKVFKTLSGKKDPSLEEIQEHVKENMAERIKDKNQEKKKAIEEVKRQALEKLQQQEDNQKSQQKEPEHIKVPKEVDIRFIEQSRARERG